MKNRSAQPTVPARSRDFYWGVATSAPDNPADAESAQPVDGTLSRWSLDPAPTGFLGMNDYTWGIERSDRLPEADNESHELRLKDSARWYRDEIVRRRAALREVG